MHFHVLHRLHAHVCNPITVQSLAVAAFVRSPVASNVEESLSFGMHMIKISYLD